MATSTTGSRVQEAARGGSEFFRAWQDGMAALARGWQSSENQAAYGLWGTLFDRKQGEQTIGLVARRTTELTSAQYALAAEWLQLPLWFTGAGSTERLQSSYQRVVEAYNALVSAYSEATVPLRDAAIGSARRAGESAQSVVKTQSDTLAEVAGAAVAAQDAATGATLHAVDRTSAATAQVVREASKVADEAIQRAEQEQARADRRARDEAKRTFEQTHPVKGHVAQDGEKIYHLPGQSSYSRTEATERFATELEAQAAGYRRAQTPGAGQVKGKVARNGEKIYHMPGQANYDRFEADALFESEEEAQTAGYRPSLR